MTIPDLPEHPRFRNTDFGPQFEIGHDHTGSSLWQYINKLNRRDLEACVAIARCHFRDKCDAVHDAIAASGSGDPLPGQGEKGGAWGIHEEYANAEVAWKVYASLRKNAETRVLYTFIRSDGFYFLDLKDDAEAAANAECNPGTLKVKTSDGRLVWPLN